MDSKRISTARREVLSTNFRQTRTRWVGRVYADGRLVLTARGSKSDAIAAIGGVMALLQEGHHITQDIREALDVSEPDEGGAS